MDILSTKFGGLYSIVLYLSEVLVLVAEVLGIFDSTVESPHFRKLKQLELEAWCETDQCFHVLTNLIDACPVLHKLKL